MYLSGPNCGFYTAGHPVNINQRNEGLEYADPISVESNVWIGGSEVVLPGVSDFCDSYPNRIPKI